MRRSWRDAPTQKRQRGESSGDEDYESATEVDHDVLADSLLSCLVKHDGLPERFTQNLLKIQKKNATQNSCQVLKLLQSFSTEHVVNKTIDA